MDCVGDGRVDAVEAFGQAIGALGFLLAALDLAPFASVASCARLLVGPACEVWCESSRLFGPTGIGA